MKKILQIIRRLFGTFGLNSKLDNIQHSINALFKYQTAGLELFPERTERIIVYDYKKADITHISRYYKCIDFINKDDNVLDIACGVGYGSRFLKDSTQAKKVTGVDISLSTINYAKNVFSTDQLEFINSSAIDSFLFPENNFDVIVSFETIEHIHESEILIKNYYKWLKKDGRLICSTPNQEVVPFNPKLSPYHVRHYSPSDFSEILEDAGFSIIKKYKQNKNFIVDLSHKTIDGEVLLYIAKKQ